MLLGLIALALGLVVAALELHGQLFVLAAELQDLLQPVLFLLGY